ncbi:MAG: TRAM domain-containing protein [Candidatus Aenigmarchaeota archaeon]|nr:TRAM domain-containing protein [Candidatus Aenigmarchaeota archaeon]
MERRSGGRDFRRRDDRGGRFGGGFRPRNDFNRDDNFEKPVKVGEKYDVEIQEVGSKGDGIARVKNFVIFVANTQKGEKCKIEIKQVSNKFAIGEKAGEGSASEPVGDEEETGDESEDSDEEETEEEEEV